MAQSVCAITQIMQRFADTVRVQAMVQSERSLCYDLLLHALEVRFAVDTRHECVLRLQLHVPLRHDEHAAQSTIHP